MNVQLTLVEKVTYECRATGESTFELFSRVYKVIEKKDGDVQLIIKHVKAFITFGHIPSYVTAFYRDVY